MKIGIDARLYSETGVGRYIRNLIKYLQQIDTRNSYCLFVQSNEFIKVKSTVSHPKWRVVKTDVRWHSLSEQFLFPSLLKSENCNLVHFPYFSLPIFYSSPFVVTVHDLILHHFSSGEASTLPLPLYALKLLGYKFVIAKAVKNASKVITVSNTTKEEIVDHLQVKPEKVVVTYEGIDESITVTRVNAKLPQKIKSSYFLYVGNAYPHKNLKRLLEAFSFVVAKDPTIFLVMVGRMDHFYRRLQERSNNMGLGNHVIFYRDISDPLLGELYRHAIALVIPSFMEGFGLPGLEAMKSRCLVLASDIPVHREIYANAAVYFNPNNPSDIASIMENAIQGTYKDALKKGQKRAEMFSWENMVRQTLAVYESCTGIR